MPNCKDLRKPSNFRTGKGKIMKVKLTGLVYYKDEYFLVEFDMKDLKMDWENPYGIIFDKYSDEDFKPLDEALNSIGKKWKPFTINEVKGRLDAGHMLFVAKKNGKIIGFFWVAMNYFEYLTFHASIHLNKDEVYGYNDYMVEAYRGKNINKGLQMFGYNFLKQKGYNRVFVYIQTTNHSSLRAAEKFGFRIIGKTTIIRIMTLEFRYHNFSTEKIVFNGGPFRLWKRLFQEVKEKVVC